MANGAGHGITGRGVRDVGLADIQLTPPTTPEKGQMHLAALREGVKNFLIDNKGKLHKGEMTPGILKSASKAAGVKQ